jgi:3-oxoacyl-[acyl-carrier protein] reductase
VDLGLAGRVAVVTGSSRGIGREIALALAAEGCHVVLCGRNAGPLEEAAEAVRARGAEALALRLDLNEPAALPELVTAPQARWGRLDVLVNNVGTNRRKPFVETTDEDWEAVLDANLRCHVRLTRLAIPALTAAGSGVVLFISSIFGREAGGPGLSLYNTTKAALISLAKILSLELAPHGIRVNSVAPGSIRFPGSSWDRRVEADPAGMAEFVRQNIPLGRFGTPQEVADVVTFLVSPRASLVTGACLNVDGGQSHSLI